MKPNLSIFNNEGIELLSDYINYKTKIEMRCSKGHMFSMSHNTAAIRVKRGTLICKECEKDNKNKKLKNKVDKLLSDIGYRLISTEVSYSEKVIYKCDKGHINSSYISNLMNGKKCPDCYGNKLISNSHIVDAINYYGYTTTSEVNGSKNKFEVLCPEGHLFVTNYDNFINSGRRCPSCRSSVSNAEKELFVFIRSIYDGTIITNDRTVIGPQELDIYVPELKLAIEYCGLYWHSESVGKGRNYHVNKLNKCLDKNINLITIFEDEWLQLKNICKSRFKYIFRDPSLIKYHACKCDVREINSKEARNFCNINHMQGYGSGSYIKLGLFFEDVLVAVMTFSKPSLAKGRNDSNDKEYELHRYCSLLDSYVVGGASKLLRFFELNYECDKLFTFADRRWSSGNLYHQLGFKFVGNTDPCYYYFRNNTERYHRFGFRKDILKHKLSKFDPDLTEVVNMYNNGYNRIWDCGSMKFEKMYV